MAINVSAVQATATAVTGVSAMAGYETTLYCDLGMDVSYSTTVYTSTALTTCADITGWTLSFLVKRAATDADAAAVVTKTTTSGITITGSHHTNPNSNTQRATIAIADVDTDALAAGTYVWELKRTNAGSESRIAYGVLVFEQTLHRS